MDVRPTDSGPASPRLRSAPSTAPSAAGANISPDRITDSAERPEQGWLLVVSNREPYAHSRTPSGIQVERPAGGLVSALDPVMQRQHGVWVAWASGDADRETASADGSLMVPPDNPSYRLHRVWVPEDEQENFYLGYANQSLWPLCHLLVEEAQFRDAYWDGYQKANARFAEAVLAEVADEDRVVWVHDYHFALLPSLLRKARPDLPLSLFWHIPWPPYDVWRVNPQRREILLSLLDTDLLAFHVERYVHNFLDCVAQELGDEVQVDHQRKTVRQAEQVTRVRAIPISIDVDYYTGLVERPDAEARRRELEEEYKLAGRRLLLGVDRLDYTKGLPRKLEALEMFFEKYPERRGEVTFVQIVSPSRTGIMAYRRLSRDLRTRAKRVNERFGTEDWTPVYLIEENRPPEDLTVLYRMAEICWVTSLYDGMNLVASEFVSCAHPRRGVLLLSEFAGASEFLDQAIQINPYDTETSARLLQEALDMPESEREARFGALRERIQRYTVHDWVERNLDELGPLKSGRLRLSF